MGEVKTRVKVVTVISHGNGRAASFLCKSATAKKGICEGRCGGVALASCQPYVKITRDR